MQKHEGPPDQQVKVDITQRIHEYTRHMQGVWRVRPEQAKSNLADKKRAARKQARISRKRNR
jgi:hypothetical protein